MKNNLIPVLIIVVCAGLYYLYISPQIVEVKSLMAEKSEYYNILAKTKEIKTQRDSLLSQYNNISSEDLDRLNKVVADKFDPISSVNNLNAIAQRNSISIKDFKIGGDTATASRDVSVVSTSPYKKNIISLNLIGRYSQFQKFLLEVESSLNLVDITGLSVTVDNSDKTGDLFNYSLTLQTYSLR